MAFFFQCRRASMGYSFERARPAGTGVRVRASLGPRVAMKARFEPCRGCMEVPSRVGTQARTLERATFPIQEHAVRDPGLPSAGSVLTLGILMELDSGRRWRARFARSSTC